MNKNMDIHLRVTEEEKRILNEIAKELRTDITKYMLRRAFQSEYTLIEIKENQELGSVICKLGNNVNQIARGINVITRNYIDSQEIGLNQEDVDDLKKLILEFKNMLDDVKSILEEYSQLKKQSMSSVLKIEKKNMNIKTLNIEYEEEL